MSTVIATGGILFASFSESVFQPGNKLGVELFTTDIISVMIFLSLKNDDHQIICFP